MVLAAGVLSLFLFLCACGTVQPAGAGTDVPGPETSEIPYEPRKLRISEVMPANTSTLANEQDLFTSWIEIFNDGTTDTDTEGVLLRAGNDEELLEKRTIPANGYAVFFLRGKLDAGGGTLQLLDNGVQISELSYPSMEDDQSYTPETGVTRLPSPAYMNGEEGYLDWQDSLVPLSDLQISEVMTYNEWYIPVNGICYDWVELKNCSDREISLGDYYLSDDRTARDAYRLPDETLMPGEMTIVYCSSDSDVGAPFGLNAQEDRLYLSRSDGTLADYMTLQGLKYGGSIG